MKVWKNAPKNYATAKTTIRIDETLSEQTPRNLLCGIESSDELLVFDVIDEQESNKEAKKIIIK